MPRKFTISVILLLLTACAQATGSAPVPTPIALVPVASSPTPIAAVPVASSTATAVPVATSPRVNELTNLTATEISPAELEVAVSYYYTGDQGAVDIFLAAYAQDSVGNTSTELGFKPGVQVHVGSGTAQVQILRSKPGPFTLTTRVQVCFYAAGKPQFACKAFPYTKNWGNPTTPVPTLAPPQGAISRKNFWSRITPAIVWCGDPNKVTMEVHIVGREDISKVQVLDSSSQQVLTLFDDGTHGDAVAGDKIFTASDLALACNLADFKFGYANSAMLWLGSLRATLKDGTVLGSANSIEAGLVDPRLKTVFKVKDLGNGLSATAYAFFIQDARHEVFDSYPAYSKSSPTIQLGTRKLSSVFPDVFDLNVIMPGMPFWDGVSASGFDLQVANSVKHIGLPVGVNSLFPTSTRLKSTVYHICCNVQDLTHELAHTWGAKIGDPLGILSEDKYHWNPSADINGELSYDPDFKDNGDGTWQSGRNPLTQPYAPLELYLMGLIPPEQVPPIHILTNPNLTNPKKVTAASVRTVTIEDIIKAEGGPREPSVATSQKDFTLAFMVSQDQPYDDAAYAYFSAISYWLMTHDAPPFEGFQGPPFYWATGGHATLNTKLPVDLPEVPASFFRP